MNNDTIKGKWQEIKGDILNAWGKITHDDLDKTKGSVTAIAGLIRQHYGEAKEDISAKLQEMFKDSPVSNAVSEKTEEVKEAIKTSRDDEFQAPLMPEQPKNNPLLSKNKGNTHA